MVDTSYLLAKVGFPLSGKSRSVPDTVKDEDTPRLVRRFNVRSGLLTKPATLKGLAGF